MPDNLYVTLIHYPVVNKRGKTIGSAVTNMDLHDIARAGRTFGVRGYYVVTPFEDQAELCGQIIAHWTQGEGGRVNPSRKSALERVRVVETFEDALGQIEAERQQPVVKIATSARENGNDGNKGNRQISCQELKQELNGNASHVLVFGTAWGLAEELIDQCDYILDPIRGEGAYNHLSVRSAATIYLDRLING